MTSDRQFKRDMEKDKSKLDELTKQYSDHEEILLDNLYHSKKKFVKISEEKQVSLDRWKNCVKGAANTSSLLEPAEFKTIDSHGKKRSIKIGPNTSAHEDILKKKNQILGFSSGESYFDSCFDQSTSSSHITPANTTYHTSFRQLSPDKKLENQFRELSIRFENIERERDQLLQENEALAHSLKSTQEHVRQIAENRDEHFLTNRRYAEENRKLERNLESALESTQAQPRRNSVNRVTFDDESEKLREELENMSKSLTSIKNERQPHNILRDVGIESRIEFFQSSKASMSSGYHNSRHDSLSSDFNISNTPSTNSVTGNSFRGNIRADAAMLSINADQRAKFHKNFEEVYGVSVDDVKRGRCDKYAPQSKVTEISNLRGTMAHRGCFTSHTPDSNADDQFMTLSDYCDSAFEEALRNSSTVLRAAQAFSENTDIIIACDRMRRICDIIVGTNMIDSRARPSFMNGGLKSFD
ncbi:hypothetical protein EYC80_002510 [Monilinia laxa]|uniref:Uncharacterized protein n=1 Tax=Monilinia laxa TaxID=61186 RepID=A0A5N6K444_MONLA|nr:hypothetical protein EYC80_002510 [Monilinia laxa]